jgi:type II secretory ATPase GspE/PulE/Tfp pilus assembly ATPase PilB-like protein
MAVRADTSRLAVIQEDEVVDRASEPRNQAGAAAVVGQDYAFRYLVVPLDLQGDVLVVDAARRDGLHELETIIRRTIEVEHVLPADTIRAALRQVFRGSKTGYSMQPNEQRTESMQAVVASLLEDAAREHASDVHIEPTSDGGQVRIRVDRTLSTSRRLSEAELRSIVSVVKHMANLRIDVSREFQDGSFVHETDNGRRIDCRVSSIPTTEGEKLVVRLLGSSATLRSFDRLGLPDDLAASYDRALAAPSGVHIVAGPTGTGKTTTVFAILSRLDGRANICTVEHPVEIRLEGAFQVEVDSRHDVSFPSAMRAFARQDPDVVLCGEMRDPETAVETMKAGLSGRTIYSTIHASDAIRVVDRLIEFGVRRSTVASALRSVLAQRLVRKLCPACRLAVDVPRRLREEFTVQFATIAHIARRRVTGCSACRGTGVAGQVAVFELVVVTDELEDAIVRGVSRAELASIAAAQGYRPLRDHAAALIASSVTSLDEVAQVMPFAPPEALLA